MKRLSTYIEQSNELSINEGLFSSLFGGLAKAFKDNLGTLQKSAYAVWKTAFPEWEKNFQNLKSEDDAIKFFNTQMEEIPKKVSDEGKKNEMLANTLLTQAGTANEKKWTKLADAVGKKTQELTKDGKFKEAYDAAVKKAQGGGGEGDNAAKETMTNAIKNDAAAAKNMGADNKDAEAVRAALITAFAAPQGEGSGTTPGTESLSIMAYNQEMLFEATAMDQFKKVFLDDKGQPVGDHLDALTNLLMALKVFAKKVSNGDMKKSVTFVNAVLKDEAFVNALQTGQVAGADDKSGGDAGSTSL